MVSRILPHELQRTLSLLAFQGWVRSASHNLDADVEIAHDNFRKVVLQSLPVDRLHRRHFRMARMLSSEAPPPWARMGEHYWKAERFREAATCYLEAARSAFRSSAYGDAIKFLERAEFNNADRSAREREDVLILKADCLAGHGLSTAAAEIYAGLANSTTDDPTQLLYRCLAGEQWIRGGEVERGVTCLAQVLADLGITKIQPTTRSQSMLRWRTMRLAATDNPLSGPEPASEGDVTFSAIDQSLNRVSVPLTFLHHQMGPDLILRMKRLADTQGSKFDQALAILHWGVLLSIAGGRWRKVAAKWLRKGRQLARQSGSPAARGSAELCMFVWYAQKGELARATVHGNKAIDWFQREPNSLQWEIQLLYWGLVNCHWFAGDLARCREIVFHQRSVAGNRGGSMSLFLMKFGAAHWSDLATGNIEQARNSINQATESISRQTFQSPRFFFWVSHLLQCVYEGRLSEADLILRRDWEHVASSYVFGASYYQWIALSARLCLNLVNIRECNPQASGSTRDARHCLNRLLRLQEPPFVAYGKAFALVLQASRRSRLPTLDQWQTVIDELDRLDHHLMAAAVRWHQSLYAPESCKTEMLVTAKNFFLDAGCQQPEKLLDIILPLPRAAAEQCV